MCLEAYLSVFDMSDLQESNDHHFSRVNERFSSFGVIQPEGGAV